jgi:DNA polymerase III delta prime subunit
MRNKRGQIYEFLLFVITVFMCGVVILLYFMQRGDAYNSLVSPKAILEMRDDVEIFEVAEKILILESLEQVDENLKFGSDEFNNEFRKVFLEKLEENNAVRELIFRSLNGEDNARRMSREFFSSVYLIDSKGEKVEFIRSPIEKRIKLRAYGAEKINFPVDSTYQFEKKYLISLEGNKYKVEAV